MKIVLLVFLLLVLFVSVYQLFTPSVKDSPQYHRQMILNARLAFLQVAKRDLDAGKDPEQTDRILRIREMCRESEKDFPELAAGCAAIVPRLNRATGSSAPVASPSNQP
jgi:hypothetical protein